MIGPSTGMPKTVRSTVGSGPCGPARADVDSRCADADRLAQAAAAQQHKLREARRQLAEVVHLRDADARVRDRRRLIESKEEARRVYHEALAHASDQGAVQTAAAAWLCEIDRLNRQLQIAEHRSGEVGRRAAELERALPGIELAADAARIIAEAAQVTCLDARRALAACEEDAQRPAEPPNGVARPGTVQAPVSAQQSPFAGAVAGQPRPAAAVPPSVHSAVPPSARSAPAPADARSTASAPAAGQVAPISLVLRGDRQTLLGLALRLADETGVEAGRLQLLLLELREQIAGRALEEHALRFAEAHPFWSQFTADAARRVAASLAVIGFHFNGQDGWTDGRAPTIRDLAVALSHCGYDPRTLRRPAGQAAIDGLWQGTTVLTEDYLVACAPDLSLAQLNACLGAGAARLGELWDIWGRLRPLLLPAG